MGLVRTPGIVLAVQDHGESDKLVSFYSPDRGRTTGIAKGARRSQRRFVNKLEPFTLLTLFLRANTRSSLAFISEADLVDAHINIRLHYERFVAACLIREPVLRFTTEHDPDPDLFSLLSWALSALDRGMRPLRAALLFTLRFLVLAGYRPGLGRCGPCGRAPAPPQGFGFHPATGGLVCDACRGEQAMALLPLSLETIHLLRGAMGMEPRTLERLAFSPRAEREAALLLQRHIRQVFQRDTPGWDQLVGLAGGPGPQSSK